jgi:Zn-dependent peptidase ImmA (M78 family)
LFERGFKTWCEQQSVELRGRLGLRPFDPLDPRALASHLKIRVCTANEVPGVSDKSRQALAAEDAGWSAVTLEFQELQRKLIILNQTHSLRRQSSDLTHEIAHHLCEHHPTAMQMSKEGVLLLETYSRKDEEEADWLSGCLLLPRPALMHIKRQIEDEEAAAEHYMVSRAMLKYRLDVSGVNYQHRRGARAG